METIASYQKAHILLVGMMGAGKTTIGQILADQLRRPYLDSDEQVIQATGKSVAEIFQEEGEAAFRRQERIALQEAVGKSAPAVISVAGGAVLDEANRRLIQQAGKVVFLQATLDTLADRLGMGEGRPLLSTGNSEDDEKARLEKVKDTLATLLEVRMPLYLEVADVVVAVDGMSEEEVAEKVKRALVEEADVKLAERSYKVYIGPGASRYIKDLLPHQAKKVVIVTSENILAKTSLDFSSLDLEQKIVYVKDGEKSKSLTNVEYLCSSFAQFNLSRHDVVVAVGGGVVTDLAGFAAASYHRGTPFINVATTLLAQIDAAIGGKTGVNIKEGKNLVGAFWQPLGVICDTDHLFSLPEAEWYSGLGEMVKYGFLGVENLDSSSLFEQICNCVNLKASIVGSDERESELRMLLNYGHTMAHALEGAGFAENDDRIDGLTGRSFRHGEAVAIGIVFAALLAYRMGRIDGPRVSRHIELIRHYGLPYLLPEKADAGVLMDFMKRDKKAAGSLTFILDGPNGVEAVKETSEAIVKETIEYMSAGDFLDTFAL
jgi:5-deoxy-5-amino-3-dehydroquinate synthase